MRGIWRPQVAPPKKRECDDEGVNGVDMGYIGVGKGGNGQKGERSVKMIPISVAYGCMTIGMMCQ